MAVARIVTFDGVTAERVEQMRSRIADSGGPPEGVPAHELLLLHDPQTERALAILVFESEDDYARGDAVLAAMPADETPGRRVAVDKYDIAVRMTAP
jgi:hypothetical protein